MWEVSKMNALLLFSVQIQSWHRLDLDCRIVLTLQLGVLFQVYLWDQSQVTILWNTKETGNIHSKRIMRWGTHSPNPLFQFIIMNIQDKTRIYEYYDSACLILSPPAKTLSCDVIMHAIHFWGQGRSYHLIRECPTFDWKRGEGKGKYEHQPSDEISACIMRSQLSALAGGLSN